METVSDEVQALIDAGAPFYLSTRFNGPSIRTSLDNFIITAEYTASAAALVGTAVSAQLTIRATKPANINVADFLGAEAEVDWSVKQDSPHPLVYWLIYGKVVEAIDEGDTISLLIADAFTYDGNKTYIPSENVLTDCTLADIYEDIAEQLGVNCAWSPRFVEIPGGASNFLPGTTLRQAAAQCAAAYGVNAIIERRLHWLGVSPMRSPASNPVKTIIPYQDNCQISAKADEIKKVVLSKTETSVIDIGDEDHLTTAIPVTFSAGEGSPSVLVRTQLASAENARRNYTSICNKPFYGGEFECPREMAVEPGDYITVRTPQGDRNVFVSSVSFYFDGGCRTKIEAISIDSFDQEDANIRDSVELAETLGVTAQEAIITLGNSFREFKKVAALAIPNGTYRTGPMIVDGVLSGGQAALLFTLPIPLQGKNVSIQFSDVGNFRQSGSYLCPKSNHKDTGNTAAELNACTITLTTPTFAGVRVQINASSGAWYKYNSATKGDNNVPVSMQVDMTITVTD